MGGGLVASLLFFFFFFFFFFFSGFKLPYSAMNSIAHRIWKRSGLEDVTSLANGFTMFRFKTEDELQKVIENDPWMFGGKAIILQK
jgi:hypothetical protein